MLYIVLALVLAAFGLLIAALTTANTLWAWLSVIVSVAAAALLVSDWVRGRRKAKATAGVDRAPVPVTAPPPPVERVEHVEEDDDVFDDDDYVDHHVDHHVEGDVAAQPVRTGQAAPAEPVAPADLGEPGEEATDASDLLVVSDLTVEVRVVDEHPRYHLTDCRWLGTRATIPIAVAEARQLGFTPCARCEPDARLSAQHRAAR